MHWLNGAGRNDICALCWVLGLAVGEFSSPYIHSFAFMKASDFLCRLMTNCSTDIMIMMEKGGNILLSHCLYLLKDILLNSMMTVGLLIASVKSVQQTSTIKCSSVYFVHFTEMRFVTPCF